MKRNELIKCKDKIFRILTIENDRALVIDCSKTQMPIWVDLKELNDYETISEETLLETLHTTLLSYEDLTNLQRKQIQEKYNLIAHIINCIDIHSERNEMVQRVADRHKISKQTVRKYLCQYLIFQDICCFNKPQKVKELSEAEKNFRYALNKYFYNSSRRSLHTTYLYLLREKYSDSNGNLIEGYPPFHKLKYFYYKNRKMDNYYISRFGRSQYDRDYQPILGDTQSFFNAVGIGMVDSTIADIWLVDCNNNLIGRANITAMVCPYSELLLGYTIGLEGGTTSLRDLMLNVNNNIGIPTHIITDRGTEYVSDNYSQLTDIGVEIINLPPYSPNKKGLVEKFFDVIQKYFKSYLMNNGVIREDFAIRGTIDYRLKATFTIDDFREIFQICVNHYNHNRLIDNIPYDCVINNVKPFANEIFNYSYLRNPNAFIKISNEDLQKVLLPRTTAKFTRKGLIVNGLRYRALGYVNKFLEGGKCVVAYNPNNVSFVFLIENGEFKKFELIEKFFEEKSFEEANKIKKQKKDIIKQYSETALISEMKMGAAIDSFIQNKKPQKINTKNVRQNRKNEITKEIIKKGTKQ